MTKVRITSAKTSRVRNRLNEHGDVMLLIQEGSFNGQKAILVSSLEKTWGPEDNKQVWAGWLTINEADWEIIK